MPTYTQIGSAVTVGSGGAATIDFTSIPSTYTDLVLKVSLRSSSSGEYINNRITFNGSTSGYTSKLLYGLGSGSGASANNGVTNAIDYPAYGTGSSATSSTFGNSEIYIPNYAGSSHKSISADGVSENNATTVITALVAGLWSNTSAITSITLTPSAGSFVQYSTAYLYGVSNA